MLRALGAATLAGLLVMSCRELDPRTEEEGASSSSSGEVASSSGGSSGASASSGGSSGSSGTSGSSSGGSSGTPPPPFDGGPVLAAGDHRVGPEDRQALLTVPVGYTGSPMPLMLLLHGTTDSAEGIEAYVRMKPVADAQGFFLLRPSGLPNLYGATSWNATDACCNYKSQPPDDSVYLAGLVEHAASAVAVDRARIVVVGHSAGGFMAYRLACDHADVFAGIASFAGATFKNAGDCSPSAPVHVLEIHGDSDEVVGYRGGSFGLYSSFPGAEQSVATWANYNGCAAERSAGAERDLLSTSGMDTDTGAYAQCAPGGAAELWKMRGAKHIPTLSSSFGSQIAEWLLARPKP